MTNLNIDPAPKPITRKGKKSLNWMNDPEILARLTQVNELILAGYNNVTIASELSLSESTIRRDRKRIAVLWQKEVATNIAEQRGRAIANYRRLQRQADFEFRGTTKKPGDKKVDWIRVQADIEYKIQGLLGTTIPTTQVIKMAGQEMENDPRYIPTDQLFQESQEMRSMAKELMELAEKKLKNGKGEKL